MNPLVGYTVGLCLILAGVVILVWVSGWADERKQRRADREFPPTTHRR